MPTAGRPRRWNIDLQEQATLVEQVGGGALVLSAVGLAALGVARIAGSHPDGAFFVAALALAGAGVVVLAASLGANMARSARRTVWSAHADARTPGVLLFVLEALQARPDVAAAVATLAPVRCLVGAGAAAGDLVGAHGSSAVGPWEAPDDRISRIGARLMTRYHPAFFAGAHDPWTGTYDYCWEERQEDGAWRILASGSTEVVFEPLVATPLPAAPVPVEAVPVEAAPVVPVPVDAAPVEAVPAEAVPVEAVPAEAPTAVEAAPVEGAVVDEAPVAEAAPVEAVPLEQAG